MSTKDWIINWHFFYLCLRENYWAMYSEVIHQAEWETRCFDQWKGAIPILCRVCVFPLLSSLLGQLPSLFHTQWLRHLGPPPKTYLCWLLSSTPCISNVGLRMLRITVYWLALHSWYYFDSWVILPNANILCNDKYVLGLNVWFDFSDVTFCNLSLVI